jgi:hypothetical protein
VHQHARRVELDFRFAAAFLQPGVEGGPERRYGFIPALAQNVFEQDAQNPRHFRQSYTGLAGQIDDAVVFSGTLEFGHTAHEKNSFASVFRFRISRRGHGIVPIFEEQLALHPVKIGQ